jgi:hypothetical protein
MIIFLTVRILIMRAYISQPSEVAVEADAQKIREKREEAVMVLKDLGYSIIDTLSPAETQRSLAPLDSFAERLSLMAGADLVVFLDPGIAGGEIGIERLCCIQYGIPHAEGIEGIKVMRLLRATAAG